jgi:ABC-type sugar transport system substrate-binding protein
LLLQTQFSTLKQSVLQNYCAALSVNVLANNWQRAKGYSTTDDALQGNTNVSE